MARLLTTGFETGDMLDFSSYTNCVMESGVKHTGSYSAKIANTSITPDGLKYILTTAASALYIRAWVYIDSDANKQQTTPLIGFYLTDGTYVGAIVTFSLSGTYNIRLTRNGTILATGTEVFNWDEWFMIELYVLVDNSSGVGQIRINSVLDIDYSGDTQPNTSTDISYVRITSGSDDWVMYVDDVAINDTTGGADNTWPGDGRVIAILPDGAGDNTDFTPSAGSNYQNVDERPPDGDTTYNESDTDTDYDLFNLAACGLSDVTILGIDVKLTVRKTVANGDQMRAKIKTGGTEYNGSDFDPSTTYTRQVATWRTNPNTSSAWTISDVDALQAGYENRAA